MCVRAWLHKWVRIFHKCSRRNYITVSFGIHFIYECFWTTRRGCVGKFLTLSRRKYQRSCSSWFYSKQFPHGSPHLLQRSLTHRNIMGCTEIGQKPLWFGSDRSRLFSDMMWNECKFVIADSLKVSETNRRKLCLIQCSQQGQMTRWKKHVVQRQIFGMK